MQRKRIKICGIKRLEDAMVAAQYGADALGFVFYEPSPRNVEIESARAIIEKLPAFVTSVALFVDPSVDFVEKVIGRTNVDLLQFHGDETAAFCGQFTRPYMKALRVKPESDIAQQAGSYKQARAILLDAYVKNVPGGTGVSFDWSLIPADLQQPIILAGGLDPLNVKAAITQSNIWGIDVSGGVEEHKGIKSPELIKTFCIGANGG